jgi:arsenite-transporting ATPase
MFRDEVLGIERLRELAQVLYSPDEDPAAVSRSLPPYSFIRREDRYEVVLELPFTEKSEIGLFKKDDELVVEVGTNRRHIGLPTGMTGLVPIRARLDGRKLVVEMKEAQ